MPTYYDSVLEILSRNDKMTIEEIINKMDKPFSKLTYIIDALKKGIRNKTIEKITVSDEKRLYLGHYYRSKAIED